MSSVLLKTRRTPQRVVIVVAVALVALTLLLVNAAVGNGSAKARSDRQLAELDLLETRVRLEAAALDVVALRMLDHAGVPGDRRAQLAAAASEVITSRGDLADLVDADGPFAEQAAELLDESDYELIDAPESIDLSELFDFAEDGVRYAAVVPDATAELEALHQLEFIGVLSTHVLIEAIAADVSVNDIGIDADGSEFFEQMIDVVREEGGWFGLDTNRPLNDSIWIEIDVAQEVMPEDLARLNEIVSQSQLLEHDAWMRELGDGNSQPELTLVDVVALADELDAELDAELDEISERQRAELAAAASAAASSRSRFLVFAAIAGTLTVAAFAFAIANAQRNARDVRRQAEMDALTGVGNRHHFDAHTRRLATDPAFSHHVVAMIDLDTFKLVNDGFGHFAGDALLMHVAERLAEVAAKIEAKYARANTTVVRLGGDEFLLSAHSRWTVDVAQLRRDLDAIRSSSIVFEGESIELRFSVGIVDVKGPHDIEETLAAADLALFEEKSRRAASEYI